MRCEFQGAACTFGLEHSGWHGCSTGTLECSSVPKHVCLYGGGRGFPRGLRCVSVPVFQHFATSSDHAENVCVVTFRSLRAHLVWNTRVGTGVPVEQSSVPVCRTVVGSCQHTCECSWPDRPAATNRPVSWDSRQMPMKMEIMLFSMPQIMPSYK